MSYEAFFVPTLCTIKDTGCFLKQVSLVRAKHSYQTKSLFFFFQFLFPISFFQYVISVLYVFYFLFIKEINNKSYVSLTWFKKKQKSTFFSCFFCCFFFFSTLLCSYLLPQKILQNTKRYYVVSFLLKKRYVNVKVVVEAFVRVKNKKKPRFL